MRSWKRRLRFVRERRRSSVGWRCPSHRKARSPLGSELLRIRLRLSSVERRTWKNISPAVTLRRTDPYGVAVYFGASFFTEQDALGTMTVIRDTDFTPSHILEFYGS